MKRFLSCVLAFCLAVCLAACRQEPSGSAVSGAAGADTSGDGLATLSAGDERGFYRVGHLDGTYNGQCLYTWVDYETLQQVPLCADPNCDHTQAGCTALGPVPGSIPQGILIVDEDTLVEVLYVNGQVQLFRCAADGSGPVQLSSNNPYLSIFLCDGTYLYYQAFEDAEAKGSFSLYRTPLAGGGSFEKVADIPGGGNLLGCEGRRIILLDEDFTARSAIEFHSPPEGASEEEIFAANMQYQEEYNNTPVPCRLYTKDIDTGEEATIASWSFVGSEYPSSPVWQDGAFYCVVGDSSALLRIDADGTQRQYALPAPPEGWHRGFASIACMAGGYAFLDTNSSPDDMDSGNPGAYSRYAIDLAGGEAKELTLKYVQSAMTEPVPLTILCTAGDSLVVEFEQQAVAGEDFSYMSRCGLISLEDFLNSTPNYREFSTPYGPLSNDGKSF